MYLTSAAGGELVRTVGDVTYRFRMPTRDSVAQQIRAWAGEDYGRLVQVLNDAGASPELKSALLTQFDRESRTYNWGLKCVMEIRRAVDVVKAASASGEVPDAIRHDDLIDLACELWGLPIKAKDAATSDPPEKKREIAIDSVASGTGT